jgi:hypothetical protein
MDPVKPALTLPLPPYDLTCAVSSRNLLGSSLVNTDTLMWRNVSSGQLFTNPITASTPSTYRFIGTSPLNGCSDSSDVIVFLNQDKPNININGYPNYTVALPIDTLTCLEDTFNLTAFSDSTHAIVNWSSIDTLSLFGDSVQISIPGTYHIYAIDTSSGCEQFQQVIINEFKNLPDVILPLNTQLNCETDSLFLVGSSTILNSNFLWTGDSISPTFDSVVVSKTGSYYLTVTRTDNGCSLTDSLIVDFLPVIPMNITNNELVCKNLFVTLGLSYSSNVDSPTFLWNNGSTLDSTTYFSGVDSLVIVEMFANNNCYGIDTTIIQTPSNPIEDFQIFKPCSGKNTGQIIATVTSGFPPFQYSIDTGATFQPSPIFTGLSLGNYLITVKDSLGCTYDFSTEITSAGNTILPDFLFSTFNSVNDTVIIVDISNPPTDSTFWVFPPNITVLNNDPLSPMIVFSDTGNYNITMNGFYGGCDGSVSKTIYIAENDTSKATVYNDNGIKLLNLFPNPNDGIFDVEIEFYKSQSFQMTIQNAVGVVYYNQSFGETNSIVEHVNLGSGLQNGTYILKVVSEFDSGYITFIIN